MKRVWIVLCTCTLALVSAAAGFAQTPNVAPLADEVLAAILGPAAVTGSPSSCPGLRGEPLFAAQKPNRGKPGSWTKSPCSATASCDSGTVSCSGSGTCIAVDRDCINSCERGHVTCGGVTTWCPTACNCNAYTGLNRWCCLCACNGDCISCCRCGGGGAVQCSLECEGW